VIAAAPRFAHQWEALAVIAARMADARAGKADAPIWVTIAADWQWVITHEGTPRFGHDVEPRKAVTARATERALAPLRDLGIGDPAMLHQSDRLGLPESTLLLLEKYELLEAIAWHEARITASGRPMIAIVTEVNIAMGRPPRARQADLAAPASHPELPVPPAPPTLPTPKPPRPTPASEPQQARLL